MTNWLEEIAYVLDNAKTPIRFFFRDDDAGWENSKLLNLLDSFAQAEIPIDLAVIPDCLDNTFADVLLTRHYSQPHLLGLHQHGFSHTNHEANGRKCEFGSSRSKCQQKNDIAQGQAKLQSYFGAALDPFFTPPWNRCSQETIACLEELDFRLLSRDSTATAFSSTRLQQISVHVDWSKILKQSANPLAELGRTIAQHFSSGRLTGIMLHHADLDNEQLEPINELLALLANHHNAHGVILRDTLN